MPEFEEEKANASQSESYTPSTDASKKPRTRRRSGGFKTEVVAVDTSKMGEVSAADALKSEKLSGQPSAAEPRREREEKPRRERSERKPRGDREPRGERAPRERKPREPREPREPRRETNPQPSPETLAAIASVEAKLTERRTERDARRAERDKNRPAKSERKPQAKRDGTKPAPKQPKKGLLASILSIFGLGPKEAPAPKKGGNRGGQNRQGGRPQGKGGNRGGQNRGRGGKPGGNRGGQGRKRGGKGPRRSDRRTNENVES